MSENLKHGGTCDVPRDVAVCPECGGTLYAIANAFDEETGAPVASEMQVDCVNDVDDEYVLDATHPLNGRQDVWQDTVEAVYRWAGAVDG